MSVEIGAQAISADDWPLEEGFSFSFSIDISERNSLSFIIEKEVV